MKCRKCQHRVNDFDKFCGNCGTELSNSEIHERLEAKIKLLEQDIFFLSNSFRNHEKNYKHEVDCSIFRL